MNFAFDLEVYEEGEYATVYTFRKQGKDESELDRFLSKPDVRSSDDIGPLLARLEEALDRLGLYHGNAMYRGRPDQWFRDESSYNDQDDVAEALWAPIPREDLKNLEPPYPSLRLYCFRVPPHKPILVAGGGGVKTTQSLHDDPVLDTAWSELKYVMARILRRIRRGDLYFAEQGFLLRGNTHFESRR